MAVRVSSMVPRTIFLKDVSPDVYVIIRPPTFREHSEREDFLAAHRRVAVSSSGAEVIATSNSATLMMLEMWLTYDSTNLVVEFEDEQGNVARTISFPPRDQITREKFFELVQQLPVWIVRAWHAAVLEVVPEWGIPF